MFKELFLSTIISMSLSLKTSNDEAKPYDYEVMIQAEKKSDDFSYFMVGDTSNDIEAARSAGIKSIFVSGGYTDKSAKELNPDYILKDMGELSDFLDI